MTIEKGSRVSDHFLGSGTVINQDVGLGLALVHWDTTPPAAYNMGHNPSVVFVTDLTPAPETEDKPA